MRSGGSHEFDEGLADGRRRAHDGGAPAGRHRPHRVLGRERPGLGGFLRLLLRLRNHRLRRPRAGGPAGGRPGVGNVVANGELGALWGWVDFYARVFGFGQLVHFDDDTISTEYSALMSTVVWDGSRVVLPINEPAEGRRKSQIEEYLDWYGGPRGQHIALQTADHVPTVPA